MCYRKTKFKVHFRSRPDLESIPIWEFLETSSTLAYIFLENVYAHRVQLFIFPTFTFTFPSRNRYLLQRPVIARLSRCCKPKTSLYFSTSPTFSEKTVNVWVTWLLLCYNGTGIDVTQGVTIDMFPEVTFTLYLRRKPLYYVVNLILPCCLLSFIAATTFILQPGCQERLGLSEYSWRVTLVHVCVFVPTAYCLTCIHIEF